jgi:hypothetical protein
MKKHKFFESYLDNDLEGLSQYIISLKEKISNGFIDNINTNDLKMARDLHDLGSLYNVFQFHNVEINKLYHALRKLMIEVCEYYGLDFEKEHFMIQGWINTQGIKNPELLNDTHYHDHLGGSGFPNFHGYYCINAEPSSTFYKIGGHSGTIVENVNKNNRLIISETGHPHGIGPWDKEEPRITIAYDISPLRFMGGDKEQHWIPL